VLTCPGPEAARIAAEAQEIGVPLTRLGTTGGRELTLANGVSISWEDLRAAHEAWFPGTMAGGS
jgi:phosphoribosylformylglycinamidine synthase